ncbi:FAST kinase domain-containing protein 2, mitochondrial isoform X2 [Ornithorhynchus anatinus]|uniref:FAST kinase domains 2 n=1 Tax=Ornithorhynchus anatinus TaxID=9258 RepID=F7FWQ1_ORNAN|nr:FAST kinase domain-containing protein 2, mitochondrial isoform X2 [Ornithorhynchus anatinus]
MHQSTGSLLGAIRRVHAGLSSFGPPSWRTARGKACPLALSARGPACRNWIPGGLPRDEPLRAPAWFLGYPGRAPSVRLRGAEALQKRGLRMGSPRSEDRPVSPSSTCSLGSDDDDEPREATDPRGPPSPVEVSPGKERRFSPSEPGVSLRECGSLGAVLDNFAACPTYPSTKYLRAMWRLAKAMPKEQSTSERQQMYRHPAFSQLCRHVMREARNLPCDNVMYSLHALVKLQIPQNAHLIQTLLRAAQERINECDERSLSVLAATLEVMEPSKNVDALRSGLRILVDQQIWSIERVLSLQTMMRCIGKNAPLSLKKKMEMKMLMELDKFTIHNSQRMFGALAAMDHRSPTLLNKCSERVTGDIESCSFRMMAAILQACRELRYYNLDLFTGIAERVAATYETWKITQFLPFLSVFESFGFRPISLMDLIAEKVTARSEPLSLKTILFLLRVYSSSNHFDERPNQEFLEALSTALDPHLSEISCSDLLKAVYSFCLLRHFPPAPLNRLLQEDVLTELSSSGDENMKNEHRLHVVNTCLELENVSIGKPPAISGKKPPSPVLDNARVEEALQKILVDEGLFLKNVLLPPHDYNIDFAIRMDADRRHVFPVTEADVLTDDSDVQRVALLCVPRSSFCLGTTHPRGILALKMRHIKSLGYHVIVVNNWEVENLKIEDAVTLLKTKIYSAETFPAADVQG